ncbi:hypothetical protein S7711_01854 [Stachybotrys chartarum IBT 7711]|uniref:37S ribosomal protein S35, mitochondrial n=1 Tax=Stachybotrys chartarum (strain CBS 109288 / IBT 7711) TaxID=1280523 RepID=A0A084AJ64_STACB|nr:hypothetical protein S7711_01854 [Stachybotrys chartarum IBT 7711]
MPPRVRASTLQSALDVCPRQTAVPSSFARSFSTTPCKGKMSSGRRKMFTWLESSEGQRFAEASSAPNYLGPFEDQPFPLNPLFRSQPVLDDSMKEAIYERINKGDPIKVVSADLGVDVRRVAAVVRLKEIELRWKSEGKKLATPYAEAVMKMLPRTRYVEGQPVTPHEPINEIPVHAFTRRQLFVPTSESRVFTRADAAKAFHEKLLPADERSQHTQLIDMEREILGGKSREEGLARFREVAQAEEEELAEKLQKSRDEQEVRTMRIKSPRCEFRIKKINAENVGKDGKAPGAVGWRYGAPLDDRKRGAVKIPTSVP